MSFGWSRCKMKEKHILVPYILRLTLTTKWRRDDMGGSRKPRDNPRRRAGEGLLEVTPDQGLVKIVFMRMPFVLRRCPSAERAFCLRGWEACPWIWLHAVAEISKDTRPILAGPTAPESHKAHTRGAGERVRLQDARWSLMEWSKWFPMIQWSSLTGCARISVHGPRPSLVSLFGPTTPAPRR